MNPSFESPRKWKNSLFYTVSIAFFMLLCSVCSTSYAQETFRPGDVDGNGIVEKNDILWWSLALGKEGTPRQNANEDFSSLTLVEELWEDSFPNGRNMVVADGNGDGVVDTADRRIIIDNWGKQILGNDPAAYPRAQVFTHARLILNPINADRELKFGEELEMDLVLEDAEDQSKALKDGLWVITFDIKFPLNGISRIQDLIDQGLLSMKLGDELGDDGAWLGKPGEDVDIFFFEDPSDESHHTLSFVIYRLKEELTFRPDRPDGGGKTMGQMIVVVEDIHFGNSGPKEFEPLEKNKINNAELMDIPLLPDGEVIELREPDQTTSLHNDINELAMEVYPVPTSSTITINADDALGHIQTIDIYDMQGKHISRKVVQDKGVVLDFRTCYPGSYLLKINTKEQVFTRLIQKN